MKGSDKGVNEPKTKRLYKAVVRKIPNFLTDEAFR